MHGRSRVRVNHPLYTLHSSTRGDAASHMVVATWYGDWLWSMAQSRCRQQSCSSGSEHSWLSHIQTIDKVDVDAGRPDFSRAAISMPISANRASTRSGYPGSVVMGPPFCASGELGLYFAGGLCRPRQGDRGGQHRRGGQPGEVSGCQHRWRAISLQRLREINVQSLTSDRTHPQPVHGPVHESAFLDAAHPRPTSQEPGVCFLARARQSGGGDGGCVPL